MAGLVAFAGYVLIHALVFEQANHHFIKSFFDLLYNMLFVLMALIIYHDRRIDTTALLRPFIVIVICVQHTLAGLVLHHQYRPRYTTDPDWTSP